MRQRLQLAAACLHRPEVLILDEPTSGVDPAARDMFWRLLGDLSRRDGVTIFVSTHFMNEAERCDRISLMHAGQGARGRHAGGDLRRAKDAASLEDAFIAYLEEADGRRDVRTQEAPRPTAAAQPAATGRSPQHDEPAGVARAASGRSPAARALELLRDRVRLGFALIGPLILMVTFGYGITFDVENLSVCRVRSRPERAEPRS